MKISASIYSSSNKNLEENIRILDELNIDMIHIDFDDKLQGVKCKDVHSDYLIALGKKMYIDRLVGYDINTNKKMIDYHIRLKGISNQSILYTARKNYNGEVIKLYEDLLK